MPSHPRTGPTTLRVFLHTGPPRALLGFSEAFSPPGFGERSPSALGAHRAAPSAAGKASPSGSVALHHPPVLPGCKEHHHPPVPAPGTAPPGSPGEMLKTGIASVVSYSWCLGEPGGELELGKLHRWDATQTPVPRRKSPRNRTCPRLSGLFVCLFGFFTK